MEIVDRRSARYLAKSVGALKWELVEDKRGIGGRPRSLPEMLNGAVLAMVAGETTLRQTEKLTGQLSSEARREFGVKGRVSDSTMLDFLGKADTQGFRQVALAQVDAAWRRKSLDRPTEPIDEANLPFGMVVFDGKYDRARVRLYSPPAMPPKEEKKQSKKSLRRQENRADKKPHSVEEVREMFPFFQPSGKSEGGWVCGEVRTLGAALVTGGATVFLNCFPVRGETNEMGMFAECFAEVAERWRNTSLFELVSVDAGMVSEAHADLVNSSNLGYLMAIKKTQHEIYVELTRLLENLSEEEADASTKENYQGNRVEISLWQTPDIAGWNDWTHLKMGFRIRRRTIHSDRSKDDTFEDRYFVTNLTQSRLTPQQWMTAIRKHWMIENNAHWILDMRFHEGKHPWSRNPHSMLAAILLRRIAFNIVSLFRGVYLRSDENRLTPWKDIMDGFEDVLRLGTREHFVPRRPGAKLSEPNRPATRSVKRQHAVG